MKITILLLKLTLDAVTGAPLALEQVGTAYESVEQCETARIAKGLQIPADGKVAVYSCAVPLTVI